ncbi:MAG: hypothetical protein LC102_11790 [Ignavibacteriales bacterium]|nr:MAG: hypothetical protein F9K26_01055 [Ignavibacteriaceae bacterium]MBW7872000.1 hypothetical protein [Ignavibacteria bacterium]MCZ2144095.1 hypothetical protein [Ignavibacteriales bacterium]OQY74355.1 MAG: hypothetical protein B6D45_07060 [Ignavibacteriales bacterium UTCHB3]MBV6446104.1 hypothetical protein [Ignavibacteriaceae bacterium]
MRKFFSSTVFLLFFHSFLFAQGGYKDLMNEGDSYLNRNPPDVMMARMKYLQALSKETNDPEVYIKIAITFIQGKDERSANLYLNDGLKLFPEGKSNMKAILTYYKGMVKEFIPPDTKDTNKIKKHFSEGIKYYLESLDYLETPSFTWNDFEFSKVNVFCDVGRLYMMINDAENGIKYFNLCLQEMNGDKNNRYYDIANFGLGQIYKFLGSSDSAVVHFNNILANEPGNLNALSELYDLYFNTGKYDEGFAVVSRIDSMITKVYNDLIQRKNAQKDSVNYFGNILYNTKMEKGHLMFNAQKFDESVKFYKEAYKLKKSKKLLSVLKKMTILSEMSQKGFVPVVKDGLFISKGAEYFFYIPSELKQNADSSYNAAVTSIITGGVDMNLSNVIESSYDASAPDNPDKEIALKYAKNEYSLTFKCGNNNYTQNFVKKFNSAGKNISTSADGKPVSLTAKPGSAEQEILMFLCRAAGK